ncbi:imm11 family protein [Sorangium sp. Soce836]|uniref:imm11 family protein n=1 Tax=Sorangium TaxID=39643 RepID=UPI0038B5B6EC
MRHFQLVDDVSIPQRWHIGEVTADDGWEPPFWAGSAFQGSPIATISRPGIPLDFSLTSFAVPVATRRVAQAIGSVADDDLQRIPLRIHGHVGFEVLNALRVVKCLDESRSEFTKWTERDHRADLAGQYRGVTKLRIEPANVPNDAHFFRIEGWLVALIVSDSVKLAMEQIGCRGAKFQEVT